MTVPEDTQNSGDTGAGGERHWWKASRMPRSASKGWGLAAGLIIAMVLVLSIGAIVLTLLTVS